MYSCCYECGSTLECCVFSRLGVHWIADLILEVHCSAVIMRVQMHWSAVYSADWECIGMLCIQQTGSALDCCVFSGLGVHWISGLIVEVHCTAVIRRLPVHWVCWCFCGSCLVALVMRVGLLRECKLGYLYHIMPVSSELECRGLMVSS